MTVKDAYVKCKNLLAEFGTDDPAFEAMCLLKKATGYDRLALITDGNNNLDDGKANLLFSLAKRRTNHEPLQYILGSWSFCGFEFSVGKGVLIPRDDTEVAVDLCLNFLKDKPAKKTIDLCAGSGAISVALSKLANADVTAVELSNEAFKYLEKNVKENNACVTTFKGDIFKCHSDFADREYDLIVSNPPYIKSNDMPTLQAEVQYEPAMALDGGESGFDFYEAIIKCWSKKLKNGGALAFELGEGQADYVSSLMKEKGFDNIQTEFDLGGVQRAIIGTLHIK